MKSRQLNPELKAYIDEIIPVIDEEFTAHNIPIHERYIKAATIFVDNFLKLDSFESTSEFMKHDAFSTIILPLFMQWFYEKYGELVRPSHQKTAKGIVTSYAQPLIIDIPLAISEATNKGTLWVRFPDRVEESENIESFFDKKVTLSALSQEEYSKLKDEVLELASTIRTIHINLMTVDGLDEGASNMMGGIWSHFEKAADDIISFKPERMSVGYWELHLAMEKTFKVMIKQKYDRKETGHDLIVLYKKIKSSCLEIESLLDSLPTATKAIKLRYAEELIELKEVLEFYKTALKIVLYLTNKLERKLKLNNVGIELNQAPWAV